MTREKDANLPPGPKMRPFDFQFSLKRLLVATAICAVFLSVVFSGLLTDDVQQGLRSHSPFVLIAIVLLVLFADLGAMHYRNGITAFEVGNYRRAITLFTRAIQADPTNPIRYCCRAAAHGSRRDYDAAISDYGNAIRQDSRCAHAWIGRAIIKMHQRCYSEAVDDATIGLCIKPDDRDGLFARGYCCFCTERPETAMEDFTRIISIYPDDLEAYTARGRLHAHLRNFGKAHADFQKVLKVGPLEGEAVVGLAITLFKVGDYDAAFREIQQYRSAKPEKPDVAWSHAWFLATCPRDDLRDGQLALELAHRSSQLIDAPFYGCEATLAAAHAEIGRFDKAVEHAEKALELAPIDRHAELRSRLADYRAGKPFRDYPNTEESS